MPARPSHLPHNLERNALQKLSGTDGLPLVKLHPTGKRTVAGMIAKGWIEKRVNGGETFRITPAGEAALKAKIPTDAFGRCCHRLGRNTHAAMGDDVRPDWGHAL